MKETWSQIETAAVVNVFAEDRNVERIRAYQNVKHPEYLIINITDTGGSVFGKLSDLGLSCTIFGDGMRIEIWVSKRK